jgi:hypothetical protein
MKRIEHFPRSSIDQVRRAFRRYAFFIGIAAMVMHCLCAAADFIHR